GVGEEDIGEKNNGEQRARKKRGKQSGPRNDGVRAKGEPNSADRKAQLEELQEGDTFAEELGKKPPVVWKGRRPNDPDFVREFLKAKLGLSLLRSANGYGTTKKAVKVRQEEGQRIAQWNKKKAVDDRQAEADRFNGDWAAAEQFKKIVSTISSIVRDQTSFNFQSSPRLG
ncbi:3288_t:CDS:1, partial [Acaulospora colombiana]